MTESVKNRGHIAPSAERAFAVAAVLQHELDAARAFVDMARTLNQKRADAMLAIIAVLGAGLSLLFRSDISPQYRLLLMFTCGTALVIVGVPSLVRMLDSELVIVEHIRAINYTRSKIAEFIPELQTRLYLPTRCDHPPYQRPTTLVDIVILVNSAGVMLIVYVTVSMITGHSSPAILNMLLSVIAATISHVLQFNYLRARFTLIERCSVEVRRVYDHDIHYQTRSAYFLGKRRLHWWSTVAAARRLPILISPPTSTAP